ncbi:MAG TPA: transcriptional regulator [Syntrophus sp. (in: bacteria)]|nr:transcriptional regulator [Syntrophus sp. (in: bacteria)]
MNRIAVEGVSYAYGRHPLLQDVRFEARTGEVLLVRGPNGSGKSTLLRLVAGLLHRPSGRVRFLEGDREVPEGDLRARLGMCAVEQNLYDELTALENLLFFGRLRLGGDCAGRAEALLGRADLHPHRHKPVRSLSSGMRQKLKLLAAVVHAPGFLLLDEPGSNLDARGMEFLAGLVEEQKDRGPVLLATNDPREFGHGTREYALAL